MSVYWYNATTKKPSNSAILQPFYRSFPTRLGERRWTQADLSRATGIRASTIGELYNELAERVNLDHLDLICEALNCEVFDILIRVDNEHPRVKSRSGKSRK